MEMSPRLSSEVPAWVTLTSEETEDLDEPPESQHKFERTSIRRSKPQSSLLTKAIMGEPEEELVHHTRSILVNNQRRRSLTSNVSIASTADLTSDTGMTSPCRTNTPSPPIPEMAALRLHRDLAANEQVPTTQAAPQTQKKRCIKFACAPANPPAPAEPVPDKSAGQAQRRPSIKFTCLARPASTQNTPPKQTALPVARTSLPASPESPSTPKRPSALSAGVKVSALPSAVRRLSEKSTLARPKFLRANSTDLAMDSSQFHEFASGTAREEDWIRQTTSATATKLTIYDTLTKENHYRRLGAEAEAEAEQEEEEAEAALEEDEEDEDDDDDDEDGDENELEAEDDEDDFGEDSDGYHTDSETGFAESDEDEDEEDENMILWTPSNGSAIRKPANMVPVRRSSLNDPQSDSSAATHASQSRTRTTRARRIKIESDAPDLPDSTDFVCGTLDEDRPLEEAYLSCLAARRNEKLRLIPQDIDPSFPASDPDNDDEEDIYNPVHHESDDDIWVQGKMEDIHHGQDRSRRRKKGEQASPRKFRSPPPVKRHRSPPPKARGRSPKPLFGRQSPKRTRSPAPKAMCTPSQTPRQGPHVQFNLAGRPGMTQTKSLPRHPARLQPMKLSTKGTKHQQDTDSDTHLRGAIDIVKGLERKRQRRKEKFFQNYCNRARRGQIQERKPQPGRGAERMKELGLLMAGKKDQGNYVLSI